MISRCSAVCYKSVLQGQFCVDASVSLDATAKILEVLYFLDFCSPRAQDEKGGGLCVGLATHHCKNILAAETPTISSERHQTLGDQPRAEAAVHCMKSKDESQQDVSALWNLCTFSA